MTYILAFHAVHLQRISRKQSCQRKINTVVGVLAAAGEDLVAAESCATVAITIYAQDIVLRWNGKLRTMDRSTLSVVGASTTARFFLTMELIALSVTENLIRLWLPCKN